MGKKKQTSTQTYKPASYVEDSAKSALGIANRLSNQKYTPYTGERVAGLSENEQLGMALARDTTGASQPYYDKAEGYIESGLRSWTDLTDEQRDAYMNPYIKGALDPAAREIRQNTAMEINRLEGQQSFMDAFGGSRGVLARSEAFEKGTQAISDLYGTGYAAAYESAVDLWGEERARDMLASGKMMTLGDAVGQANRSDIETLMNTGAIDRTIQQAMLDFDYQQFIEERDWDFRSLGALIAGLEGVKGSTTTTQTSEQTQSGGEFAQALGIAATLIGTFYGGPAVGMAMGKAVDSQGYGGSEMGPPAYET